MPAHELAVGSGWGQRPGDGSRLVSHVTAHNFQPKKCLNLISFMCISNVKVWFNDFFDQPVAGAQYPQTDGFFLFFHTGFFTLKKYNMQSVFSLYNCVIFNNVRQKPIMAILKILISP